MKMRKLMALVMACMLMCVIGLPAVAEDSDRNWTEEELRQMDEALSDENDGHLKLQDTFRYYVAPDDLSIREGLDPNWMNILLLGTDTGALTLNTGRSDSMIICSVNLVTGQVRLSSIVRDLYVDIPYMNLKNRINTANAFGGPTMAMKCVNETFGLNIERYCSINFKGFQELVDVLGGVDLELTGGEANIVSTDTGMSVGSGLQHLNGAQALSYCRIRQLDNNFGRNERQRKFLAAMITKVMENNTMDELVSLVETGMKYMDTNLTTNDIFSVLFAVVPMFEQNGLEMYSCPAQGEYSYKQTREIDVVVANHPEVTTENLHSFIYGK